MIAARRSTPARARASPRGANPERARAFSDDLAAGGLHAEGPGIDPGEACAAPGQRRGPGSALRPPAPAARPLEPILFPKLRIQFADFPYLHCSIGQRLCTLETCCGCGYGPARNSLCLPRIFTGRRRRTGHRQSCGALRRQRPYLGTSPFQGVCQVLTKKRELFPGPTPPSPSSLASPRPTGATRRAGRSPRPGSGMLTRFPFDDAARALSRRRGL